MVQEGRVDSTLSMVAKVWADLLLGHTAPPGTTGTAPPPSWAQIVLLPPQACPLVDGLVTLLSSWGWLSGSPRFSSVQVVCMLPWLPLQESSGPLPRCTTEVSNAAHAANETMVQCEVIYFTRWYNIYCALGQLPRGQAADGCKGRNIPAMEYSELCAACSAPTWSVFSRLWSSPDLIN